jgi:hypothetical protein
MPEFYPYKLRPWTGRNSRTACPSCGHAHKFSHYIHTETGELLPDEYGRCDREENCGYHVKPTSKSLGLAGAAKRNEWQPTYSAPVWQPPKLLTIPADVYRATLGSYERNNLAQLLRQHFGLGVANDLLRQFRLGTSAHWPGASVFWLIDELGRVRGGQVVQYDSTGYTVKTPRRHTTWAHTALARVYEQRGHAQPAWLLDYSKNGQKSPCLFGLPQLATALAEQPVALVESAKTAIVATPYFPRFIWLATMGLSYLTADRLQPLRSRRIVLFPDAGAFDKWQARATELCRQGFNVQVSGELEKLATEDERKAGLDVADVLLREWPGYPPSWDDPEPLPPATSLISSPQTSSHA